MFVYLSEGIARKYPLRWSSDPVGLDQDMVDLHRTHVNDVVFAAKEFKIRLKLLSSGTGSQKK